VSKGIHVESVTGFNNVKVIFASLHPSIADSDAIVDTFPILYEVLTIMALLEKLFASRKTPQSSI